jgi:hypothetical protein
VLSVFLHRKKNQWKNFTLCFFKKINKDQKTKKPIFFGVKKTLYSTPFSFFKTLHSFFFKYRFLFYTVYSAGVIFGNIWCTQECKCKCKKKYTALQCLTRCKCQLASVQVIETTLSLVLECQQNLCINSYF